MNENAINKELKNFISDFIKSGDINLENIDDWHQILFNTDYYMIGYFPCSCWLSLHDIGELEGASICIDYTKSNFGECSVVYDNTEVVVNMLVYIFGEAYISEFSDSIIDEINLINEIYKN